MVGGSNILTVSYGTFSCTLEGFDEPFSTMKAIAEYFRDLAADDRYFGAEPPTPDAEMLHRIAEREIHRRVEAKINSNGNGVVLRPEGAQDTLSGAMEGADSLSSASLGARDITVSGATDEELSARGIPARSVAASALRYDAPQQNTPQEPAPEDSAPKPAVAQAPEAESVAAKLQRIRAAVAQSREREAAAFSEDQHAEATERDSVPALDTPAPVREAVSLPQFDRAESDFGFELDIAGPIEQDEDVLSEATAPASDADDAPLSAPLATQDLAVDAVTEAPAATVDVEEAQENTAQDDEARVTEEEEVAARIARRTARRAARAAAAEQARVEAEAQIEETPTTAAEASEADDLILDAPLGESIAEATADNLTPEAGTETTAETAAETAAEALVAVEDDTKTDLDDASTSVSAVEAAPQEVTLDSITAALAAQDDAQEDLGAQAEPTELEADLIAPQAEPAAPRLRARVIKVRRAEPAASPVEDETEASIKAVLDAAPLRLHQPEKAPTPQAAAMPAPQDQADESLLAAISAELAETQTDVEIITDVAEDTANGPTPTASTGLSAEAEKALAEELAALQGDWDQAEAEDLAAADAPAAEPMHEHEAPDAAEVAAPEAEAKAEAHFLTQAARALTQGSIDESGSDVARLMDEANTKIERPENRRRFSAIAHLKAAVAATVADRKMRASEGKIEQDPDTTEAYRADLTRVVRPRRPEAPSAGTQRPATAPAKTAPLMLVSEQRVDEAQPRSIAPVRPRRISAADLAARIEAAQEDEDTVEESPRAGAANAHQDDFAEFAEKLGATGLADLLEAAAAYSEGIEGRPHFSRPQIIRKVAALTGQSRYDREAGLRSFGALLREGKIEKVKRGQFAITETSRFFKEARRAGA